MSASTSTTGFVPEPEDPRLVAANLTVGIRLFASAMAFVFMAFVFAFFYLGALNSNRAWRLPHVSPPQGYGVAILIFILACTGVFELARRGLVAGSRPVPLIGGALFLAFVVVVLQILEFLSTGFGDSAGGYASVFYGWTSLFLAFWLGAVYAVETTLATAVRGAREIERAGGDPVTAPGPSANATMVYLYACAAIAIITWVLLYLIK